MKYLIELKKHFDYRYSMEIILQQLDFLYRTNEISIVDYFEKKDKICAFLYGDVWGTVTIKDLLELRKHDFTLDIKDIPFFYSQISIGTFIQTNIYSGYLTKKVIIENERYFQLDDKKFFKMNEITKIGY